MATLEDALKKKLTGLYYNNRVILPFHVNFMKVICDTDIITDFSPSSKGIYIRETDDFTDVYFHDYKNLKEVVSKYEVIKMVVVEKGKDIYNFDNHKKIILHLKEKHTLTIEETEEDILFIE
jgi:hypothetical protein